MWSYDVKIAMRSLWRQPGFMALAVLTLAVGIGANAAIFSAVQAVLLRPLPFPDAHRLVAVFTAGPKLRPGESSPPDFVDWRGVQTSLAGGLAALTADSFAVTGRASAEQVPGASVTGDFFAVLGVSP